MQAEKKAKQREKEKERKRAAAEKKAKAAEGATAAAEAEVTTAAAEAAALAARCAFACCHHPVGCTLACAVALFVFCWGVTYNSTLASCKAFGFSNPVIVRNDRGPAVIEPVLLNHA